jgi:hypothetical protein
MRDRRRLHERVGTLEQRMRPFRVVCLACEPNRLPRVPLRTEDGGYLGWHGERIAPEAVAAASLIIRSEAPPADQVRPAVLPVWARTAGGTP